MMKSFVLAVAVLPVLPYLIRAGGITYRCYAFDKQYKLTVTPEILRKTPAWTRDTDNPPVNAKRALDLAGKSKARLVKDAEEYAWKMTSASLVPARGDRWYWLVEYTAVFKGSFSGIRPYVLFVVLMDGTVVEPELIEGGR
jgi:hypothetical protein